MKSLFPSMRGTRKSIHFFTKALTTYIKQWFCHAILRSRAPHLKISFSGILPLRVHIAKKKKRLSANYIVYIVTGGSWSTGMKSLFPSMRGTRKSTGTKDIMIYKITRVCFGSLRSGLSASSDMSPWERKGETALVATGLLSSMPSSSPASSITPSLLLPRPKSSVDMRNFIPLDLPLAVKAPLPTLLAIVNIEASKERGGMNPSDTWRLNARITRAANIIWRKSKEGVMEWEGREGGTQGFRSMLWTVESGCVWDSLQLDYYLLLFIFIYYSR